MMKITKSPTKGWEAISEFEISNDRFIRISTFKSDHGIKTSAYGHTKSAKGILCFSLTEDFSKKITVTTKRATEKNIQDQHQLVLKNIDSILAEANHFYHEKK